MTVGELIKELEKIDKNKMIILTEPDGIGWDNIGIVNRKYHRWAIQNSRSKDNNKTELTWDERLECIKNTIEHDKLLNRHSKPYEQRTLDEMLKLGEEEFTKISNERNKRMMDILNDIDFSKYKK